ncbi:MAG: GNAT family N-acetyltransferase [Oscillospiraceae bacterium]|jgi:RimJ/RimL family protein N-acetyltransferase|nr:GNAT family N-acetyltransferase [Oscillospiraceae bacterium]
MKFVELETERLRLRACRADDFDDVFALYSDRENMKYTRNIITNADTMREALMRWVGGVDADPCYDFEWIIELKSTDEFIGHALVMDFGWQKEISPDLSYNEGHCETSIFILPQHQRQGYGREIKRAVLDFMFESLNCREHVSSCDERNIASQRIIESVGMKFDHSWDIPKAIDGEQTGETERRRVYTMSRADWEARDA